MEQQDYDSAYYESISSWNAVSFDEISHSIVTDDGLSDGGMKVLDLGCGTGLYSKALRRATNEVIGIDFSRDALRAAAKTGANVAQAVVERIPFAAGSVDYVFSTEVIEHVESPAAMLREIRRVLRPGGTGLLTTTTFQFIVFHYMWVLSAIGFRFGDAIKYPLGYISKTKRDEFVRILSDYTGGHLWGFMKKDLVRLFKDARLEIRDVRFMNAQPIIPFKLEGTSPPKRIARTLTDRINGLFLNKPRAPYGPNIVIKFGCPAQ